MEKKFELPQEKQPQEEKSEKEEKKEIIEEYQKSYIDLLKFNQKYSLVLEKHAKASDPEEKKIYKEVLAETQSLMESSRENMKKVSSQLSPEEKEEAGKPEKIRELINKYEEMADEYGYEEYHCNKLISEYQTRVTILETEQLSTSESERLQFEINLLSSLIDKSQSKMKEIYDQLPLSIKMEKGLKEPEFHIEKE